MEMSSDGRLGGVSSGASKEIPPPLPLEGKMASGLCGRGRGTGADGVSVGGGDAVGEGEAVRGERGAESVFGAAVGDEVATDFAGGGEVAEEALAGVVDVEAAAGVAGVADVTAKQASVNGTS